MNNLVKDHITVDEEFFSTPDMGEYMSSRDLVNTVGKEDIKEGEKALFYVERPFEIAPGYYSSENVFIIGGKPVWSSGDIKYNPHYDNFDGDTLYLRFNEIIDDGKTFIVDGIPFTNIRDYIFKTHDLNTVDETVDGDERPNQIGIRFLGIDTPETPKYSMVKNRSNLVFCDVKIRDLKEKKSVTVKTTVNGSSSKEITINTSSFSFVKYRIKDGEYDISTFDNSILDKTIKFVCSRAESSPTAMWYEVVDPGVFSESYKNMLKQNNELLVCIGNKGDIGDAEYHKQAQKTINLVKQELLNASDIVYMLDGSTLSTKKGIPNQYLDPWRALANGPWEFFKEFYKFCAIEGQPKYSKGYRYFGQEINGRCLGAVYYKTVQDGKEVWINLAKRLLYEFDRAKALPSYSSSVQENSNFGYAANVFKLWTYDKSKANYIDSFIFNSIKHDDRDDIQKAINPLYDKDGFKNHTMFFGDCMFMVPPTSIRVVTQTDSMRVPLMRAKGSLVKTIPKNERIIEIDVFFNKEDGINGAKVNWPMPSGTESIYHMNGIRALIAQFKLTPFLPITNNYVNYDLAIEAVTLNSYNITTVPNYPRTLKCTITCTEFNYRQYMPEILPPDANLGEDIYTNLFAKTIHWPVFRYYYQRSIKEGEELDDVEYNSKEYIERTLGQKTALQKSHFKDPMINFYIANEESLKKRYQLKKELENTPLDTKIEFSKDEREFLFELGKMYGAVTKGLHASRDSFKRFNELIEKHLPENSEKAIAAYHNKIDTTVEVDLEALDNTSTDSEYKIKMIKRKGLYETEGTVWKDHVVPSVKELNSKMYSELKGNKTIKTTIPWYKINNLTQKDSKDVCVFLGSKIEINWGANPTVGFEAKLKKFIAKRLGLEEKLVFNGGHMFIGYDARIADQAVGPTSYYPFIETFKTASVYNTDVKILGLISNLFGMQFNSNGDLVNESELDMDKFFDDMEVVGNMKEDLDIESGTSIQFDEYFAGYPIVTGMSFSYNNVLNSMSLKAVDGQSAQYMGGSDTVIDVSMITKDDFTVRQLKILPDICTRRLIDFRKIMTSSPLRVKCDIAQMMGINEIIIESININTVESSPGLREINMRLVSVDRTLRNRESLKKIDSSIAGNKLNANTNLKNYFDLKRTLKRVELYPDLELPTIGELEMHGFNFIRYKMKEDLIFPDPDFYFVYNHLFTSDAIRETITSFFSVNEKKQSIHEVVDSLKPEFRRVSFDHEDINGPLAKEKAIQETSLEGTFDQYKKKYQEQVQEVMKDLETNGYDAKKEWRASHDMNQAHTQGKLLAELKECLEYANEGTINYGVTNKPSVSCGKPLGLQNSLMLKDNIKYEKDGTMTRGVVTDTIGAMNKTLKFLILKILKEPIPTTVEFEDTAAQYKTYNEFFRYLIYEIINANRKWSDSEQGDPFKEKVNFELDGYFNDININYGDIMENIFIGLGSGATGEVGKINADSGDNSNWKGRAKVKVSVEENGEVKTKEVDNIMYVEKGQGISSIIVATTEDEKKEGMMFGKYAIKKMSPSFLSNLFGITLLTSEAGFIDPYYNKDLAKAFLGQDVSEEEAKARESAYRSYIMEDKGEDDKATHAILRIMLVWLYRALSTENQGLVTNSIYSVRRAEEYIEEIENSGSEIGKGIIDFFHNGWNSIKTMIFSGDESVTREKEIEAEIIKRREEISKEADEFIKGLPKAVKQHKISLFNGMWTMLGMLALGEFNTPVWGAIQKGNIGELDNFLITQKGGYRESEAVEGFVNKRINRFLQYIDYETDTDAAVATFDDKMNEFKPGAIANRVYIKMAEKPSIYMMHSFYDMVMNDYRGRMARAFPTFYMLLIDEGKHIGIWKLQDNFYDVSSITEIQVVKSRKIAADTAKIGMTNLFGTYTLEDEDMRDEYNYTFKDAWNSIFQVRDYFNKEHTKRKNARDINRANILPGTKVHLRAGYGGDASLLPTIFNGVVAEIENGEIMTLVCQGNGVQTANPSMFNATDSDDVADLIHNADIFKSIYGVFSSKSTPRNILAAPLLAKGTFVQEAIKNISNSRFYSANPFGMTAFGDINMKEIFSVDGEVCQNIYEGLNASPWTTGKSSVSLSTCYATEEAPSIRVELQGSRSYWDLMNIAASVSPDFISAIADFDLRSTIFHGHPRYYYAYSYTKNSDAQIIEKRKPFQQYHVFTSESDIVGNNIMASQKDIRTNARGIYTGPGVLTKEVKTIGPLFLDINIYPENQKSTTINCNFEYKASDFPLTVPIKDWYQNKFSETGGYEIAWRATANGLRECVKEMYKGELTVVGYPSIKPYDRFYLSDVYEDMQGLMEVQQVVHTISPDIGFVTSVTPDCISSIMDDYDKEAVVLAKDCLLPALGTMMSTSIMSAKFIKTSRAMFMTAANFLGDTSATSSKAVNAIAKTLGVEDIIFAEGIFKDEDIKRLRLAAGVTEHDYNIQRTLHKLELASGKIPKSKLPTDFKTRGDLVSLFDDFEDFAVNHKNLDPSEFSTAVDDALEKGGLSAKNKQTLEGAKEYNKLLKQQYDDILDAKKISKFNGDDIKHLLDAATPNIQNASNADELMEMIEDLKKLDVIDGSADGIKNVKKLKTVSRHITKIDDDTAKVLSRMSTSAFGKMDEGLDGYRGIKNGLKGVKAVTAGGKLAAMGAAIIPTLIAMGAEYIITKSIQDFIEKGVKDLQVLTVFPIMKNGKAYTAGLLGNQGSVYGSVTYNDEGHFQKMIGKFFASGDEFPLGPVAQFVRDLFIDSGSINELLNQQQNAHRESDAMLKNDDATLAQKDILHSLIQSETSGVNAYKQLHLYPRYSLSSQDELTVAVAGKKFENISDIQLNRRIMDELIYIFSLDTSDRLREKGVLKFSAEGAVDEKDMEKVQIESIQSASKTPGVDIAYNCRVIKREGKFSIYDIPYLRSDCVVLLDKIIEKIAIKIQPDYKDATCDFKELHNHNIVVHNGTRINDSSYYNTGFAFSIEVKNSEVLSNILREVHQTHDNINGELFKYRKDKKLNNVYEVFVAPKK